MLPNPLLSGCEICFPIAVSSRIKMQLAIYSGRMVIAAISPAAGPAGSPPTIQKGMFFIMAKQTMEAIRQAELNAEQLIKSARAQADAKRSEATAQAELMIAEARQNAAKKLSAARSSAEDDSRKAASASYENVTNEIDALRRQCAKNEAKAIQAVIAAMS